MELALLQVDRLAVAQQRHDALLAARAPALGRPVALPEAKDALVRNGRAAKGAGVERWRPGCAAIGRALWWASVVVGGETIGPRALCLSLGASAHWAGVRHAARAATRTSS